jgi:hypothetical protein
METVQLECSFCGEPLDGEESDSPRLDPDDGKPTCDDCYHEHFEFTCCCCQNYGEVADQHNLLVVLEETSDVKPGVYKVVDKPYYTQGMIGSGWLHPWALERIADLNPDIGDDGYPCGHLCLECQRHILAQFTGKCSVCGLTTASCLKVKLGSWKDFKALKYQWTRRKNVCATCRHNHRGSWKA